MAGDAAAISMPAAQAVGHNPGWLLPSAYHLFGLQHPWSNDSDAFATTETGQLLINRSAQCYTCLRLGHLECERRNSLAAMERAVGAAVSCLPSGSGMCAEVPRMYIVGLSGPSKHG